MTDHRLESPTQPDALEARLSQAARDFAYPTTPDLAAAFSRRALAARRENIRRRTTRARLALAGVLLAVLLAVILGVPPVRAAVVEWIRVGAVRIFLIQPTQAPNPTPIPGTVPPRSTPAPTATPLSSVLDLSGVTSLDAARRYAGFDIRLPAALAAPDRVYYQELGGPLVILVWLDPDHTGQAKLALFETNAGNMIFQKFAPTKIADTDVNGKPAVWVEGPYFLETGSGDITVTRLVSAGHTLVWTEGSYTYRLETSLELEEARKIAESLK